MKITLKNHIEITDIDEQEQELIEMLCTHDNPKFEEAKKQGRYTGKILREIKTFSRVDDGLVVPIGTLSWLETGLYDNEPTTREKQDDGFIPDLSHWPEIDDQRNSHPVTIPFMGELRPYQEAFVQNLINAEGGVGGVGVAATGAGKTVSGIALAARLGQRCLILVNSGALATQWQAAGKQFTGLEFGMIGGGKNTQGEQFTIGLVQTLVNRNLSALDYGLVIADECHNAPASQFYTVINGINAQYKYGLSATPQRRDSMEFMIHAALGEITATIEADQLMGKVLPVEVRTINIDFDGEVNDWNGFVKTLIDDDSRNDWIIRLARQQVRPTIILCSQVRHCEILTTLAAEAGLKPLLIHGQLQAKVRAERMAAAQTARLIIGTAQLMGEGLDIPHLEVLIFAAPMSAVIEKAGEPAATKLIQSIGRCRRPFKGKTHAIVYDLIDRCGFGIAAAKKRGQIYRLQGFEVGA
ncbi:DEAD/DEAH box helicase family protein [Methylobacter sp. G7]|uniref:DEAD/DEAH box helicase n=1 Tax=Methylobacter sp. G7 TaxID=3230117 RepID=UPI003D8045B4